MSMNKNSMGQKIYDAMGLEAVFDAAGLGQTEKDNSKAEMSKLADGIIQEIIVATISVGLNVTTDTKTIRVRTNPGVTPETYEDQEITYVTGVSVNTTGIS